MIKHRIATFLSENEIKDILRQPNRMTLEGKRDYAILLLFLSTGIRRNELCTLKRNDLKWEGKKVWLYVWGKGGRQRRIPIRSRELIEAIGNYWEKGKFKNDPNEPMFKTLGRKGPADIRAVSWKAIRWLVAKYAKLAKIDKNIHPHSLRHTFITHALRKSGDLPAVQALAGHKNISNTQIYLHTDEDRMEKAIAKLATIE